MILCKLQCVSAYQYFEFVMQRNHDFYFDVVALLTVVLISFISYELYHRKRDRFEEETKKQLVGNIVLTRLVRVKFSHL